MTSDTYSVTLPVPDLGVRRARALCNHLKPTVGADSVDYQNGTLKITWANQSNTGSDLKEFGNFSLTGATSQCDGPVKVSENNQTHRTGVFDHSEPDGKTVRHGKKACALRVHNDETGGESCHVLRQDLEGDWSAVSGAIAFPQEDKTLRVEDGDITGKFLPGKIREVHGRKNKWSTVTTVSPAPFPPARSLNQSSVPATTGRSDMPVSESVITLDVPKDFPDARNALTYLGGAIGAKSIAYNTKANSVQITLGEPTATGSLREFIRASLSKSNQDPDGQSENRNQTELDPGLESHRMFAGDICSLYIAPADVSIIDPANNMRKTHTFIRDLEGNLSVASGANGRQMEGGGMGLRDGDTGVGFYAGSYTRKQGEGRAWTIETMQAPKPDSELHSPELVEMLRAAKPRTENATRDATVVTII